MYMFEIRYRPYGDWVKIQGEEFDHNPGPARDAFFVFVKDQAEAIEARVRIGGQIIEHRRYHDDI